MAQTQNIAFPRRTPLNRMPFRRTLPRGAWGTTKSANTHERAIASRRFWRGDIFLLAYTCCHRGMFYSLLIHAALLSALLASPIPIPPGEATAKAYLMPIHAQVPIDSRLSAPSAIDAGISSAKKVPLICCAPQTILSNPPHATNRLQTILQPDLPNLPALAKFIPLPNILTVQRISWRPGAQPGANLALQPLPIPTPDATIPSEEKETGQALQGGRGGHDENVAYGARDTLALSVAPSEAVSPPLVESRGRFAEKAFASVPADSPASETASSRKPPSRAEMLFSGITIQGGEWKPGSTSAEPLHVPPPPESQRSSYALSIASSGNSGGGLRDFGIFANQSVFTDYFDVSAPAAQPAPPWVLQYAFATPCCDLQDSIVPPLPTNEVLPAWPPDLVTSHSGETIVVYAVIDTEGKLRDTRLVESPSSDLNSGVVEALAQWIFQPAERNGKPCVVKALLGIPVAAYR